MQENDTSTRLLEDKFKGEAYIAAAMLEGTGPTIARAGYAGEWAWRKAMCWAIEAMRCAGETVQRATFAADEGERGHTIHLQRHGDRFYAVVTLTGHGASKSVRRMIQQVERRLVKAQPKAAA